MKLYRGNKIPRRYRNPFLAPGHETRTEYDRYHGLWHPRIHVGQARRYFPMPDYDFERTTCGKDDNLWKRR